MENRPPPFTIERMVNTYQRISPRALLNKKRLYTTQGGIDTEKLIRAYRGDPDINSEPPVAKIGYNSSGEIIYQITDGNHRTGIACIRGEEIPVYIEGLIPEGASHGYGFNLIVQKVAAYLKDSL